MGALLDAFAGKRIAVVVGSGGVGKTTVAAAIALSRALAGGRALVCTIDPARRLASALGLASLGNVESRVPTQEFDRASLLARGELWAMMLDVKRTWDDLIARHAPSEAQRDRILQSRIYQQVSGALAGSQEYMAMEKLYELATERDYDLVVLDTPPTAHALDFLEAPDRILDFLGNDTARMLLAPAVGAGKLGLKLFQLSGSYVAKTLSRFTGSDVLRDVADFMDNFQGMYEGFKSRAAAVRGLLGQPEVGFVLVSSASPLSIDEALFFHGHLRAGAMPVAGVVANRVTPDLWTGDAPLPSASSLAASLGGGGEADAALAARLARTLAEHQVFARSDGRELKRLWRGTSGAQVAIPRLRSDVHDLGGLAALASWL
ncbi:MAG TPA: ArsA-related P-loop ATPase [Anaeromyxobacteraceae bacterium]|nr:ArsA-related P-loop ATPase [Anaeromyxobacteraceae bacterium]